jgi:hypothetical protein
LAEISRESRVEETGGVFPWDRLFKISMFSKVEDAFLEKYLQITYNYESILSIFIIDEMRDMMVFFLKKKTPGYKET